MGFDYSDGRRVEEVIAGLLDRAPDLSSRARIAWQEQDRQWPVRYHLAPERANLLRHLDLSGLDVLELGAGMGGVSRSLAEGCGHLTVVEGSSRRFRALARRLSDLDNWSGWFGRLEQYEAPGTFDVICLIGVLEYAERFIVPPEGFEGDAFDYLLQRIRGFLRPQGVLLLAIENRLGLKYWSGVAEDHSGALFDGLMGYPDDAIARTFSRQELLAKLSHGGWHCQREYFPFPDYKLPASVIDGSLATADPELAADLACFQTFADPMRPRSLLFSDYLAMQHLTRSGLFSELANSFLWAASPHAESPIFERMTAHHGDGRSRQVAWHASPSRRRPVSTRFFLTDAAGVEVEKLALGDPDLRQDAWTVDLDFHPTPVELCWQAADRRPVEVGERLRHRLLRALYFRRGRRVVRLLTDYLKWARQHFVDERVDEGVDGEGTWLRGDAVDALLSNVVVAVDGSPDDPSRYRLFDQEWRLGAPLPLSWFVLRNVACLLADVTVAHPELGFPNLLTLYRQLCQALDIEADLERDVHREAVLQGAVSDRPSAPLETAILEAFETPFSRVQPPREADFARTWDQHLSYLVNVRHHLEAGQEVLRQSVEWQQWCLDEATQQQQEQQQAVAWLQANVESSREALAERTEAIQWLQEQVTVAREAEQHLHGEYQRLTGYTRELEGRAQQQAEQIARLAIKEQELALAARRIDELYGCLEDLTTLLNGRAHRWVEAARRLFWKVVRGGHGPSHGTP